MSLFLAMLGWLAAAPFTSPTSRVELHPRVGIENFSEAKSAAFSTDGTRIAVAGGDVVNIFDAESGGFLRAITFENADLEKLSALAAKRRSAFEIAPSAVAIVSNRLVVREAFNESILVFDIQTGRAIWFIPGIENENSWSMGRESDPDGSVLASRGSRIASVSRTGTLTVADVEGPRVLYTQDLGFGPLDGVALDSAGERVAVRTGSGAVVVVELSRPQPRVLLRPAQPKPVALAWDHERVIVATKDATLLGIESSSGRIAWRAEAVKTSLGSVSPEILVDTAAIHIVTTWGRHRRRIGSERIERVNGERNEAVAVSPCTGHFAVVSSAGLRIQDPQRTEPLAEFYAGDAPETDRIGFDPDTGDFVIVDVGDRLSDTLLGIGLPFDDGLTTFFDDYDNANTPIARIRRYRFSAAGIRTEEQVRETHRSLGRLRLRSIRGKDQNTQADGAPLAARVISNRIEFLDLMTDEAAGWVPIPGLHTEAMALSPDGAFLAIATTDGLLYFDTKTRGRGGFLSIPFIADLRFEGESLAFVSWQGVGRIVDGVESFEWSDDTIRRGIFVGPDHVVVERKAGWAHCTRDGSYCRSLSITPEEEVLVAVANTNGTQVGFALREGGYALLNTVTGGVTRLVETQDEWILYDERGYFAATRRADRLVEVRIDGKPSELATLALTHNDPSVVLRGLGVDRTELLRFYDAKIALRRTQLARGVKQARSVDPATRPKRGRRLFYVGLAVGDVRDPRLAPLNYADDDARDLRDLFETYAPSVYEEVRTLVLENGDVSVDSLEQIREFLADAMADDDFVLFASGHGVYDRETIPNYYYVLSGTDTDDLPGTAIQFKAIETLLARARPVRKLFLLDTCNSGVVDAVQEAGPGLLRGRLTRSDDSVDYLFARDRFVFNDLQGAADAIVMSSSRGTERSYERWDWRNGAFTEAVLEGLTSSAADSDRDGNVTTDELADFVARDVKRMTADHQHPMVDRGNRRTPMSFPISRAQFREGLEGRRRTADVPPSTCAHTPGSKNLIGLPILALVARRRRRVGVLRK